MTADKRRAERISIFEITNVEGLTQKLDVEVQDISLHGVRFLANEALQVQMVYQMTINYNPIDFPLRMVIVWNRPAGKQFEHGAEFINIPENRRIMLEDHLKELKRTLPRS